MARRKGTTNKVSIMEMKESIEDKFATHEAPIYMQRVDQSIDRRKQEWKIGLYTNPNMRDGLLGYVPDGTPEDEAMWQARQWLGQDKSITRDARQLEREGKVGPSSLVDSMTTQMSIQKTERPKSAKPKAVKPKPVGDETTSGLKTSDLEKIKNEWESQLTQLYAEEGRSYEPVKVDLSEVMKVLQGKTVGKAAMYKIMDQTGMPAGLANAFVEQEKERRMETKRQMSYTPRSAADARMDRLLHTQDSSGRRSARPKGGRQEPGRASNVTVRMSKSK